MTLAERIAELARLKVLTLPENFDRRGRFYTDEGGPMSDEQRWSMVAIGGSLIRRLAKLAVRVKVPKHVVVELFSDAYDEARDNERSAQ